MSQWCRAQIPAGLPKRIHADRELCHPACETGSQPAFHFQSDIQIRPHHRLQRPQSVASRATARRSKSDRDTWRLARIPEILRHAPFAPAVTLTGHSAGHPERASHLVRPPGKSQAWLDPRRKDRGIARCNTAGTGADEGGSGPRCTTEPGSSGESDPQFGRPDSQENTARNRRFRPYEAGGSHRRGESARLASASRRGKSYRRATGC